MRQTQMGEEILSSGLANSACWLKADPDAPTNRTHFRHRRHGLAGRV